MNKNLNDKFWQPSISLSHHYLLQNEHCSVQRAFCIGNIVSHHFYWLLAAPSAVKSWNSILAAHQLLATYQLIAIHQLIATHQLLVSHPLMTVKLQVSINISNVMFVYKLVLVILLYNFVFYIDYQLYNRQWWFCCQI